MSHLQSIKRLFGNTHCGKQVGYLKYKGYMGSVEYSEKDKCLFGKVQGMFKDCITYEGDTVDELTADFQVAVDDYLKLCAEKGVEPRKPYSGVLKVCLTPEIHSGAAMAARRLALPSMRSSGMLLQRYWA